MVITDTMSSIEWTRDEIQRLLSWDGKRSIQAKDVYAETIGCVSCVVVQFDKSVYNKSWCKEDLYALDAGLDMVNIYSIRANDDVVEVVYRELVPPFRVVLVHVTTQPLTRPRKTVTGCWILLMLVWKYIMV